MQIKKWVVIRRLHIVKSLIEREMKFQSRNGREARFCTSFRSFVRPYVNCTSSYLLAGVLIHLHTAEVNQADHFPLAPSFNDFKRSMSTSMPCTSRPVCLLVGLCCHHFLWAMKLKTTTDPLRFASTKGSQLIK